MTRHAPSIDARTTLRSPAPRQTSWRRLAAALALTLATQAATAAEFDLEARIVAVGVPGIGGIRQVGRFHAGGPIPGNPEFLLQTRPGRVLDPQRLLVTSTSNFGAPRASDAMAPGSVLSIASTAPALLRVAPGFAAAGGQSSADAGAIQLFTAQSPAFLNRIHNGRAATASLPAVAGPRYISINNAFGRPWFASAPDGAGLNTVVDPNGRPLDNAPSTVAGGVFSGGATNRRDSQFTPGDLAAGALGTAFLGPSPDASGFAVFAVVKADGSIVQIHVQDGVDGLAPAGTLAPIAATDVGALIGIAFNWVPDRILFIVDRARDRVAKLTLADDGRHFTLAATRHLSGAHFKGPSDVAPAIPEIANPRFSSHTTLAGNADLYVANRGDGSIVRITQDGALVARARPRLADGSTIGPERLRGIAVSADAQRVWLTLDGPDDGAIIEITGFDATGPFRRPASVAIAVRADAGDVVRGEQLFATDFSPEQGLGPLFNAQACVTCHNEPMRGGMSTRAENFALRVARLDPVTGRATTLADHALPIAPRFATPESGARAGIPSGANVVSMRMPTALFGLGRLDEIPDEAILAHAVAKGDGIRGRPNRVVTATGERRIERYGWKADIASLDGMVAAAFANELGITGPQAPGREEGLDDADGAMTRAVAAFLRQMAMPAARSTP